MKILIVGGGRLVYFLSRTFLERGYKVTIINRDHDECSRLARLLSKAVVVHGDGSDPQILEEAGAETTDVVLAVTPKDQDNLVICQLAELRFHVPRNLALVNDPDNETVFRQLGITGAFSVTQLFLSMIEQRVALAQVANLIPLFGGKINITEVLLTEGSPVVGKALRDIALPEDSLVASILRGDQPIVPRGTTVLQENDRLVVMTMAENHGQVLSALTGISP
jgi:trk system potassium uptake protein TrkA